MSDPNLDSGCRAEDLETAFAPKAPAKPKNTLAGLTAKQQKEVTAPSKSTKSTK